MEKEGAIGVVSEDFLKGLIMESVKVSEIY